MLSYLLFQDFLRIMKKILSAITLLSLLVVTLWLRNTYLTQDAIILRSTPLAKNYEYAWNFPFEEVFIQTSTNNAINGLLFFTKSPSKGVILYLHGRGSNLGESWGFKVQDYVYYGYDVFSIDYRGFGKSDGVTTEETLLQDSDLAYAFLQNRYPEENIIVYGQSLGTSFATHVASQHKPKMLILEAPYYSMIDMGKTTKPYLPQFLINLILKYHLRSDLWIKNVTSPIHIFHGTKDQTIPYASGKKLFSIVKDRKDANFYTLDGWGHEGIMYHKEYITRMNYILESSRQIIQISN